jgi:hypothetical protein
LLGARSESARGGRTYDALVDTCTERGTPSTVATFNAGDFTQTRNIKSKDATTVKTYSMISMLKEILLAC